MPAGKSSDGKSSRTPARKREPKVSPEAPKPGGVSDLNPDALPSGPPRVTSLAHLEKPKKGPPVSGATHLAGDLDGADIVEAATPRTKRGRGPRAGATLETYKPPPPITATTPGRPTLYTDELAQEILDRVALGEVLPTICAAPDMPDRVTVWRWTQKHETFRNALARAREERCHSWGEDTILIADGQKPRVTITEDGFFIDGGTDVHRDRLRIDARKSLMAAHNPARYGAKVQLEGNPANPVATVDMTRLTPEQIAALANVRLKGEGDIASGGDQGGGD